MFERMFILLGQFMMEKKDLMLTITRIMWFWYWLWYRTKVSANLGFGFGLGLIPNPKPMLADTFGRYRLDKGSLFSNGFVVNTP